MGERLAGGRRLGWSFAGIGKVLEISFCVGVYIFDFICHRACVGCEHYISAIGLGLKDYNENQ